VLDRHYSIFSVLGERFLQVRWHRPDCEQAGEWAIQQQGNEPEIQHLARNAIVDLFKQAAKQPPGLPDAMRRRIAAIAEVTALARTHVFRSSYGNREIEYVPESEANTRISKQLAAVARGIAALAGRTEVTEAELQDAFRVAIDCWPEYRRRLMQAIRAGQDAESVAMPRTIRGRELEELIELGILTQTHTFSDRVMTLLSTAELHSER
jgi:Mg-chelatase subunit ChlI